MTSATVAKTILLGGKGIQREAVAASIIRPGDLIHINADGEAVRHATAGGVQQAAVAVEYDMTGRGIDDNYAIGDQVIYHVLPEGAQWNAIIAASQNIAVGDLLTSAGNGNLREAAAGENVVATARAAVATGVGETARCKVEVLKGYISV